MLDFQKKAFSGGIHPSDGTDKAVSKEQAIVRGFVPKKIALSLKQSPSGIIKCCVSAGDHVNAGDLIGEAQNFTGVALHASVSGTVSEVDEAAGIIYITPDELQPSFSYSYNEGLEDISAYSCEELIGIMKDSGLCGMGGAGFPTHVKFTSGKPISYVLINAAECESYLTCDYRVMLEEAKKVVNGVNLFKKACGAAQAIICTEDNKADAAAALKPYCDMAEGISVKVFPTRYPQGSERQLIKAAMGREVPIGGLPADAGAIVVNVQTAKAFCEAVFEKKPLIGRVITITGMIENPKNFEVPLGTPLQELMEMCGSITTENYKIILGGPMTGTLLAESGQTEPITQPLTKVSGGLCILEDKASEELSCIRCQKCKEACPAGLTPWKIDFNERRGNIEECEKLYASECIACGCCSWICPAKRELCAHTTLARDKVKTLRRERGQK